MVNDSNTVGEELIKYQGREGLMKKYHGRGVNENYQGREELIKYQGREGLMREIPWERG